MGMVDITRINFAILALIPKIPGDDRITQYHPIALINVIFKLVVNVLCNETRSIAAEIVDRVQTTFIKGRLFWKEFLA